MSKVTVAVNSKNGLVFTPSQKPSADGKSRGFCLVESSVTTMENGFVSTNKRVATLTMETSVWDTLNWKKGESLLGRIVVHESYEPFYATQEPKINPTTKAVVLVNGKKVYRQQRYTEDPSVVDALIIQAATPVKSAEVKLNKTVEGMNA